MDDLEPGEAEYLCYEVVKSVRERAGDDLPKTEFNKQCYLVYKELQEEGTDVGLPVYWYEHGIMVDLEELADRFLTFEPTRWQSGRGKNAAIVDDWEADQFDVNPTVADRVQKKAIEVANRFKDQFDTSVVKDETYEKYGNQFVQSLNEYRYYVDELDDTDAVSPEDYVANVDVNFTDFVTVEPDVGAEDIPQEAPEIEEELLNFFDELVETYPEDTYDQMHSQFRQWESISRQLAMNHMFSQLSNFMRKFWVAFSRGELRIEHNENISSIKVRKWQKERSEVIAGIEDEIQRYRSIMLQNRKSTDELEAVSDSFSQAVRETYTDLRDAELTNR